MALAKKCDICGGFFEHDVCKKRNGFAFCKISSKGTYNEETPSDACPTCIAAIEECLERCKNRPVAK